MRTLGVGAHSKQGEQHVQRPRGGPVQVCSRSSKVSAARVHIHVTLYKCLGAAGYFHIVAPGTSCFVPVILRAVQVHPGQHERQIFFLKKSLSCFNYSTTMTG